MDKIRGLVIGGGTKAKRLLIPMMHLHCHGGGDRRKMQNRVSAAQFALSAGLTSPNGLGLLCSRWNSFLRAQVMHVVGHVKITSIK